MNERNYFEQVLTFTRGKLHGADGAAALVGLKPTTLQSKLKKHGILPRHFREARTPEPANGNGGSGRTAVSAPFIEPFGDMEAASVETPRLSSISGEVLRVETGLPPAIAALR
jgi:hypothetical protein